MRCCCLQAFYWRKICIETLEKLGCTYNVIVNATITTNLATRRRNTRVSLSTTTRWLLLYSLVFSLYFGKKVKRQKGNEKGFEWKRVPNQAFNLATDERAFVCSSWAAWESFFSIKPEACLACLESFFSHSRAPSTTHQHNTTQHKVSRAKTLKLTRTRPLQSNTKVCLFILLCLNEVCHRNAEREREKPTLLPRTKFLSLLRSAFTFYLLLLPFNCQTLNFRRANLCSLPANSQALLLEAANSSECRFLCSAWERSSAKF